MSAEPKLPPPLPPPLPKPQAASSPAPAESPQQKPVEGASTSRADLLARLQAKRLAAQVGTVLAHGDAGTGASAKTAANHVEAVPPSIAEAPKVSETAQPTPPGGDPSPDRRAVAKPAEEPLEPAAATPAAPTEAHVAAEAQEPAEEVDAEPIEPQPTVAAEPAAAAEAIAPAQTEAAPTPAAVEEPIPSAPPETKMTKPAQVKTSIPIDAPPPRRGGSAGVAWLVAVIVATGGVTALYAARSDLGTERAAHAQTLESLGTTRAEVATLQSRIAGLEAEKGKLELDRSQLAEEARQQAEALAAMQHTQEELQHQLQEEVAKGGVLISQQHGELVVDLIDQVVFDSGEAELNERGKKVLRQVGETLARVPDKIIQVSGHTDSLKISDKLEKQFPTNWELSTARATNVVRYLQDDVKIPGARLIAAGLAEFRPIARNTTKAGRSRNRRIEVRLLPLPKK